MLTWIEINTPAIQRNIQAFRDLIPKETAVMAVVKANAYGHGLDVVAPVAAGVADWLGVNTVSEAAAARALGLDKPIAILGHTDTDQFDALISGGFRQVLYRADVAEGLSRTAQKRNSTAHIHLKIETGTNRQGIPEEELGALAVKLRTLPNLNIEGVYTHFANIEDTLDPSFAQLQLQRFRNALDTLAKAGIHPTVVHTAATAGALLYPETAFTMIRVGIGAYGIWPSRETQLAARERGRHVSLTPALTWKTRVVQVKTIKPGDYVGYGLTYRASRNMKVAVLPVGYYDGYDRGLSNNGRVLLREQPVPVVGRVAMNMMMVDATDVGADLDEEVVLLGRQGSSEIRAEELAEKTGTISYEIVSRINPQIPRIAVS